MNKRKFTPEQIDQLSQNPFVKRCSEKSITYSRDFKLMALQRYDREGLPASRVFEEAGFPVALIGKDRAKDLMRSWRKIYKTKGFQALLEENRGRASGKGQGRPKTRGVTDKDKIERLEATVAYLKAENDFLIKLRAKRRE